MSGSLRDRYLKPKEDPQEPPEEELIDEDDELPDPLTYQAYAKGTQGGRRGEMGLVLYYEDGITIEVLYYTYLMRVIATGQEFLALMCTDSVYTLTGQNLHKLLPLLREHRIRFLQAFQPQKHAPLPANDDEPVIDSISMLLTDAWWEQYLRRNSVRETDET